MAVCGSTYSKRCAESQIAVAPADTLKTARIGERRPPLFQLVRMIESRATMTVATGGPKSNTAANTNASETETRALIDGSLMLNAPVRRVRVARISHSVRTG